jgi:hypothetical protein
MYTENDLKRAFEFGNALGVKTGLLWVCQPTTVVQKYRGSHKGQGKSSQTRNPKRVSLRFLLRTHRA